MKIHYLLLSVAMPFLCQSQKVEWNKCTDWKLYKISTGKALHFNVDSLTAVNFIPVNKDTLMSYLNKAVILPAGSSYIWMGSYCVSCINNSVLRKINISTHAGFFYDEFTKRYYQIPVGIRSEWLEWWTDLKRRVNEL